MRFIMFWEQMARSHTFFTFEFLILEAASMSG